MWGFIKFLPLIPILGGAAYAMHIVILDDYKDQVRDLTVENQNLSQRVDAQEFQIEEQLATIKTMQEDFKNQEETIIKLQSENNTISSERDQYLSIFKRHDMVKLSLAMPGMMENRINDGTKEIFETLTKDTTEEINNEQGADTDTASKPD